MRGTWFLGVMALAAVVAVGARWSGYPTQKSAAPQVNAAPVPLPGTGFTEGEKQSIAILQTFIVAALDDLEPTRGTVETRLTPDGKRERYVTSGKFGMSRVGNYYNIDHGDERLVGNLDDYEPEQVYDEFERTPVRRSFNIPHLVVSADGKPLTHENMSIVWRRHGQELDADAAIVAAIRKNLAAAKLGEEFAFEVPGFIGWAKPLKLTKKECLSCHPSMKVGETAAISAYFTPKD